MRMRSTSVQRTYRYVRLSIVGVIVFLGIGVAVQTAAGEPLASVSAAYYTPARDVFVGSLCAVSLALLALSGRSLEQVLLDLAALFAPVIALVPTPIEPGDVSGATCPTDRSCVPVELLPGVTIGVVSLLVLGAVGLVAAVVIAAVQGELHRGVVASLGAAAAIVGGGGVWWMLSPTSFVLAAHDLAAVAFFALFAAVAGLAAARPVSGNLRWQRRLGVAYAVIASGIVLALLVIAVAVIGRAAGLDLIDAPLFFLGEGAALVLFAAFWVVQTIEFWNDPDPRLVAARR